MSKSFLPVDLSGYRVVITAAGSGIGKVSAEGFLARGARVYVSDIQPEPLSATIAATDGLEGSIADVADEAAVDRMFADALAKLGGIDVLINNAGVPGPACGIEKVTPEDVEKTLAVNVKSQFHCSARAVKSMRESGGGSIINMSSVAGRLAFPNRTPYAAAKWGVIGFSKSLAMEVGRDNIRVNAILPGHVEGDRFRSVWARRAIEDGLEPETVIDEVLDRVALGRTVAVEDIVNMQLFLASPFGASVSGQALSVCGGVEMMR
ncbi:MAG: SDR family oxidoreductase [Rhizobiaceae bacterium]|nr:SDR family oxidoreductase [Rhizobiaceae bacterium]